MRVTQGARELLSISGRRDSVHATFDRDQGRIGSDITVSPESPLVFEFTDRDMAAHDRAGKIEISEIRRKHGESVEWRSDTGVRMHLLVEAR